MKGIDADDIGAYGVSQGPVATLERVLQNALKGRGVSGRCCVES